MEESTYLYMYKRFIENNPLLLLSQQIRLWYSEGEGIPYETGGLHRFCRDVRTKYSYSGTDVTYCHYTSYIDKKQIQKFKNDVKS